VTRRRLLSALPALAVSLAAAACLLLEEVRVPGQRGGLRVADGFRIGRWDARFLVARGAAAIRLPHEPARVSLRLSGPARLRVRSDGGERPVALLAQPQAVEAVLPSGGALLLEADAPIRLHEARVARASPPVPWRLFLVGLAAAAAAALAWIRPGLAACAASFLLALLAAWLSLRGTLGGLFARVLIDRCTPLLVVCGLLAAFLLPRLVPLGRATAANPASRLPAAFAGLLAASCLLQLLLFEQPRLIGDPGAYYEIGGRFRDALLAVRSPDDFADAAQALRPYAGLAFAGLVYGLLRALRDQAMAIYLAQALALGGAAFFLVRSALRLQGARLAAVTGVLALGYATFPILAGIVLPEPFILLAWTFAFDALLAADEARRPRRAAVAGVAFALGLALHPQGIWVLLPAVALLLAPFFRRLLAGGREALLRGFAVGLVPVLLATAVGEAYARPVTPVLDERHGFWAYTAAFPLGFWLFVDTDGWQGPMRIDDTRYARSLRAAEESGQVAGFVDRALFTARFVTLNLGASLRTVLRNVHRLLAMPDNPPRRDYPYPYPLQVLWHRTLVVLFLLGVAAAFPGRAALAYVPLAMLVATYPLYHIFNKYAVPAMPFLLLGAALALLRIADERQPRLLIALAAAGVGAALPPAALAFGGLPPLAARFSLLALHVFGLAAAFHAVARAWATCAWGRGLAGLALFVLVVPTLAAQWGDPGWRRFDFGLDRPAEHEIALGPAGLIDLNAAREAYLALDLLVPSGDPSGLELRFRSGLLVPGAELQPTMPAFGLATARFHRDRRSFRQWWRVAWRPEMADAQGLVGLTVRGPSSVRIFGSLDDGQPASDRGLSLGQWPLQSVYRLMHDGEYRLVLDQPLASLARSSRRAGAPLPGLWGIRLLTLDAVASRARVETAPVPQAARTVVTAVWGRASEEGPLELETPSAMVVIRLERREEARFEKGRVRFVPSGDGEGWLLLRTSATPGEPLALTLRPRQEMVSPPRRFEPELRGSPPVPLDWTGAPYVPVVRVLESSTAPWRPGSVY
jgi:hypothetical protein